MGKVGGEIASPGSNRGAIKSVATSGCTQTTGAAKSVRGVHESHSSSSSGRRAAFYGAVLGGSQADPTSVDMMISGFLPRGSNA